jgi:hypothetical protein
MFPSALHVSAYRGGIVNTGHEFKHQHLHPAANSHMHARCRTDISVTIGQSLVGHL